MSDDSEVWLLPGTELYDVSLCGNETASSKLSTLSSDTFENFLFLGITAGLLTVHGDYKKHFNDYKILEIIHNIH